jgi:ketosteroid isomerase-like protein
LEVQAKTKLREKVSNGRTKAGALVALTVAMLLICAQVIADDRVPSIELPAELDRVLRDYEAAWSARDPKALAALFAEDGFVLQNGHPPVRGRDAIAAAYAGHGGPLALRALAFSTDGSAGWIIGAYAGQAGKPDEGKFILALKKSGTRWMIAADMDNSNRRPQRPATP